MGAQASSITTKAYLRSSSCDRAIDDEDCSEKEMVNKAIAQYTSLRYRIHSGMSKLGKNLKLVEQNIK